MFRKAALIFSGNAVASALGLLRNLLIARMISVEDFGIAATFALAMSVVEMLSALGLQQQIIQARDGDDPWFQSALQGFHLLRGVISAMLLMALAGPIARFMGVPEVAWAYRVMALVPLLNGLGHFDTARLSRRMNFLPMVLTGVVPVTGSLLSLFLLVAWFGDYRVMLFAILVQAAIGVTTSHLVAQRAYHLRLDRGVMLRSFRFGWPLLLNGILLFLVFQGDKIVVGRELGMEPLAILSMGFTLTLAPTLLIGRSVQNLLLPLLSAAQDDPRRFQKLSDVTMQLVLALGALLLIGTAVLGGAFVTIVLGERYAALPPLLIWLALMQAVRIFKGGSSTVALSQGQTANAMIANLPRAASLALAWYAAAHGSTLEVIVWIGIGGEAVGLILSFLLIYWRLPITSRHMRLPACGVLMVLAVTFRYALVSSTEAVGWLPSAGASAGFMIAALLMLWSMCDLRHYALDRLRRHRRRKATGPSE